VGLNPDLGEEVYRLRGVHAMGLNSQTGIQGSPVFSLIRDRWQQLNLEAFNHCPHCQVDTDFADYIGGAELLAWPTTVWSVSAG